MSQRYGAMGSEKRAINNEFRDNPYNDKVKESSDNLFLDEDEVEDNAESKLENNYIVLVYMSYLLPLEEYFFFGFSFYKTH
jgi:hypothetical protein